MRSQGFGKRKSNIGMTRPKKAKIQQLEESGLDESTGITGSEPAEESEAAAPLGHEEPTVSESEEDDVRRRHKRRATSS